MILILVKMVMKIIEWYNEIGYINYSEFVAACLARKEGLKHEYAELIFEL